MRAFELHRDEDPSGVSGTGVVAEGVEFTSGTVVLHWLGPWPSTTIHNRGIDAIHHIHGHGGSTRVVWT